MGEIFDSHPGIAERQYTRYLEYFNEVRPFLADDVVAWFSMLRHEGMSGPVLHALLRDSVEQKTADNIPYMVGMLRNILARCEGDGLVFNRLSETGDLYG